MSRVGLRTWANDGLLTWPRSACALGQWKYWHNILWSSFCIIKLADGRWWPILGVTGETYLSVYEVACQILERFERQCIHWHTHCIAYAAKLKEECNLWPLHDDRHAANAAAAASAAAAAVAAVVLMSLGHDWALALSSSRVLRALELGNFSIKNFVF